MLYISLQWCKQALFTTCAIYVFTCNFSFNLARADPLPEESDHTFAFDVINGLSDKNKHLSSKYLYDDEGSRLFTQVMASENYYLARCEREILINQSDDIASYINTESLNIIELGAGDGTKTVHLLDSLQNRKINHLRYSPIDISGEAIRLLRQTLEGKLVDTDLYPIEGDYLEALPKALTPDYQHNLLLFLGGNIGNFTIEEAKNFLRSIRAYLKDGDHLLLGFDLKKDINIMQMAYSGEEEGVYSHFHKNLLQRINRELGGNFDSKYFKRHPFYNPLTSAVEMYLISTKKQNVYLKKFDINVGLDEYEGIRLTCSKKSSFQDLQNLAKECGFQIIKNFTDSKNYFVDSLWRVNKTTQ